MNDPYDEIPIPDYPVLSEEESARQLRDDFTRHFRDEIKQLRQQRESMVDVLNRVMEEFNERYDGAPDSGMKWMGSLMHEIELVLEKAGVGR